MPQSMDKIVFRLIGLFALIIGVFFVYDTIREIINLLSSINFITKVNKLVFAWIAIYGGYQLFRVRGIGHRLMILWLSWQTIFGVLAALGFVFSIIFRKGFRLQPYINVSVLLNLSFYVFCVIALIFLLKNQIIDENNRHIQIIGKLLSLLTPGLGRALIGNVLVGFILFYTYELLMIATISSSNPARSNLVVQFLYNLVVWRIFSGIDWGTIENDKKSTQEKPVLTPKTTTSQINSG